MNALRPIVQDAKELQYLKGWGYHNQLGTLDTRAPHVLPSKESFPRGVTDIREQEITRGGFLPTGDHAACYLYRAHPGPSWIKDGAKVLPAAEIAPHWVTGKYCPLRLELAQIPRKYETLAPSKNDVLGALRTFFYNHDINVGVSTGTEPMNFFFRNADGDDLFFVHQGKGFCETELGVLAYEEGHYLWLPKGIAYRFVPTTRPHHLLHMENYGPRFQKPDTGFTGDAAVFYHRNIEVPTARFVNEPGKFVVVVKANGNFTAYTHPHHPMDVVGWDGTLFPFRLHIHDVLPITSWRAHVPPSAYCTFIGSGFELCSFVPRPVETGTNALPVPFDHINIDRDEVIFYSRGTFFSKDESSEGSMTFHPRGFSHGPHPAALKRAWERREREGAFTLDGYFVMVESMQPLYPTEHAAALEDKNYINSWQS